MKKKKMKMIMKKKMTDKINKNIILLYIKFNTIKNNNLIFNTINYFFLLLFYYCIKYINDKINLE